MPKHTIEFNLPEERSELETSLNAGKYISALSDLSSFLRGMTKYEQHPTEKRPLNEVEHTLAEQIRSKFYEILADNEVADEEL